MTASVLFFSEGDSLYNVGDYEGAIKNYTAAIRMTTYSRSVNATTDGDEATIDDNRDAAETKVVQFRSLSHRSEAYLSLSKYEHAYADARAALALYSSPDSVDDFSTSAFGLRPWEMEAAHDRVTRALAGNLAIVISSLQRPHENVKFVASSCVAFPPNAELQRRICKTFVSAEAKKVQLSTITEGSKEAKKKSVRANILVCRIGEHVN